MRLVISESSFFDVYSEGLAFLNLEIASSLELGFIFALDKGNSSFCLNCLKEIICV